MIRRLLLGLALIVAVAPPAWSQARERFGSGRSEADVLERQRQCAGKSGWSDRAPPVRIYGNTYDVGTCGITVLLVTGPAGHVLIDGATVQAVPSILANIARLGVRPRDVKLLLMSHSHFDHVGGLAALQRATGGRVLASGAARPVLRSGRPAADDPQAGDIEPIAPVRVAGIVTDGETLTLGPIRILAHSTPGHAPDGMSWSWLSCEDGDCLRMVFADSLSAVAADGYRFTDHPEVVARLRGSIGRVAGLRCDILLTPHPEGSDMAERLAKRVPLVDPRRCPDYAAAARARLENRLLQEKAALPSADTRPGVGDLAPFCPARQMGQKLDVAILSPAIRFRVTPTARDIVDREPTYRVEAQWPYVSAVIAALCEGDRFLPTGTPQPAHPHVVLYPAGKPEGPYLTLEYPDAHDGLAPVFATLNGRPLLLPQPLVREFIDTAVHLARLPRTGPPR